MAGASERRESVFLGGEGEGERTHELDLGGLSPGGRG